MSPLRPIPPSRLPNSSQHSLQLVTFQVPRRSYTYINTSQCRARDPTTGHYSVPLQLGLFATYTFRKNDFIAPFQGQLISVEEADLRTSRGHGGYQIRVSRTVVLDCFESARSLVCKASYANSARNLWDLSSDRKAANNAKLCISHEGPPSVVTVCLRATRVIFPNQEILFPYQSGYRFPTVPDPLPCPIDLIRSSADEHPTSPDTSRPKSTITTLSKQELIDLHQKPVTTRLAILRHMERQRLDK